MHPHKQSQSLQSCSFKLWLVLKSEDDFLSIAFYAKISTAEQNLLKPATVN